MEQKYAEAAGILYSSLRCEDSYEHIARNMSFEAPIAWFIRGLYSFTKGYQSTVRPMVYFDLVNSLVIFVC
jgi:hypothetical protein